MTRVLIHPGFAKTGTTTLQDHFFGPCDRIACFAKPFSAGSEDFIAEMRKPEGYYDHAKARGIVDAIIAKTSPGSTWIVSAEGFSHNVHTRKLIAERLARLFPEAQVFFTIREQISCLYSVYGTIGHMLSAPRPYNGRFVDIEAWIEDQFARHPFTHIGEYLFDETIAFYEQAFGRDRIRVLMFEQFVKDRDTWLAQFSELVGISSNEIASYLDGAHSYIRPAPSHRSYMRLRSKIAPSLSLRNLPGAEIARAALKAVLSDRDKDVLPQPWIERLSELYAPGNRRLAESYELPLSEYGYTLK